MSFKIPPFSYTNNCFNCNSNFVFWKGKFRHHCHICGNNFCNECVQNYCALPHIGLRKEVRSCDSCYQKYNCPQTKANQSDEIFYDSVLLPSEVDHGDLEASFVSFNLNEQFEEVEEENAQYLPDIKGKMKNDSQKEAQTDIREIEERQLAIALSLSKIEDQFLKYATDGDSTVMSEEDEIKFALKLSELEDQAKQIVTAQGIPQTKQKMSEEEELALALAISKIENEDFETVKPNKKKPDESRQVYCPICFEERLEYALIDCGHVVCGDCKPKLVECPICRAQIRGAIRVYITD